MNKIKLSVMTADDFPYIVDPDRPFAIPSKSSPLPDNDKGIREIGIIPEINALYVSLGRPSNRFGSVSEAAVRIRNLVNAEIPVMGTGFNPDTGRIHIKISPVLNLEGVARRFLASLVQDDLISATEAKQAFKDLGLQPTIVRLQSDEANLAR